MEKYNDLFSLLSIPSISASSAHKEDMNRCAQTWQKLLLKSGVQIAEVMATEGNPVIYAEYITAQHLPTLLIYGHYDVMPVEPLALWKSDPFIPLIKEGRIYARGADDDKGQSYIQVKGFEKARLAGDICCNVKFLIEGEEEIGSTHLTSFCENHKELLKCDLILVSDTSMLGADTPSITTGLRGLAYWQVAVTGPNKDLHSGIFGGAVANPINELCKLLAGITDQRGKITIPGFYDKVENPTPAESQMMAAIPHDDKKYGDAIGVSALFGEEGYSTIERTAVRPTFDICGIWGGYTGEGSKTVLPSQAFAKISCRLVPHQESEEISRLMIDYLQKIAPPYIKIEITPMHGGEGYVCPIDMPAYAAAEKAYTETFGCKPLAVRRGGSIPIISAFEKILGVKTLLMGFGVEENQIHSPNESISIDLLEKGIETVAHFYKHYSSK